MIDETSLYNSVLLAMEELKSGIYHPKGDQPLLAIKGTIAEFKQALNRVSLNFSLSMEEKLEFYFSINDQLMGLTNKYQLSFQSDHSKVFFENFVELRILNQFLMWAIVSNSYHQHKYSVQISANLLSKVLESQSFEVETDFKQLSDIDSLDEFGRIFNFHQTSAGLYSAALMHLPQIHKENAKEWIQRAFSHFTNLYKLLNNLDFQKLYELTLQDPHRDFFTLCSVFIFPSLDFVQFIKTIYHLFGSNWADELDMNSPGYVNLAKQEFMERTYHFFVEIKDTIFELVPDHIELAHNESWTQFDYFFMLLQGNVTIVKLYSSLINRSSKITNGEVDELIIFIQSLHEIDEEISRYNTSLNYYILDALEKLVLLVMESDLDSVYKDRVLELVPEYLDQITGINNHGLRLLYTIYCYNKLKAEQQSFQPLLLFVQKSFDLITVESGDSLMLRILHLLILHDLDQTSSLECQSLLDAIEQKMNTYPGDRVPFEKYLSYIRNKILNQPVSMEIFTEKQSDWDWRGWVLPNLDHNIQYIPLHMKSRRIRYD